MPPSPIIWFADDWGRHPSSSQYLVRRMLARRPICWVNTIGTRKPSMNLATIRRGFEKLRHWSRRPTGVVLPANLQVFNPLMWPWFSHPWDRWLNRRLLVRQLQKRVATMTERPIVVTTLPLTADLIGCLPVVRWVYYCVDDYSAWPGLDGEALRTMERDLVFKADQIIAVSEVLRDRIKAMGRSSELLTHGVDLGFWNRSFPGNDSQECETRPASTTETTSPVATLLFWGVIDRRMDTDIVRRLAAANIGTVLLVGPQNDPDPAMLALTRVQILPPQPLEALPSLARRASVLVMPYADLPVTRAMQPLKLKEYLATGLPCVVRDLPANREWAECLDLADAPDAFVQAVQRRLETGLPESQRIGRLRLQQESWDEKAQQFEQMIDG